MTVAPFGEMAGEFLHDDAVIVADGNRIVKAGVFFTVMGSVAWRSART